MAAEQWVRGAAERVADWARFAAVVERNRIVPLVRHALGRAGVAVPQPVSGQLSHTARTVATRALELARESLRLQRAFDVAGLDALVLKGVPLGILAYGELAMKESWDIDMLVAPEAAVEAMRLLEGLGYTGSLAHLDSHQLAGFMRHAKEAEFFHPGTGITAELHWGLADNPRLLRGVGVKSDAQAVAMPGGQLRTLADNELFAYLAVHGAMHNWSRLKWLADLGALLARRSRGEISELYRFAEGVGAGRPAALALVLCDRLLGLGVDDELLRGLRRPRILRVLEGNVLAGLDYRGGAAEHEPYTAPWFRSLAAPFLLAPGAGYALAQARTMWQVPVDRSRTPLPRRLAFLYPWLRVPLWLGRVGGRILGRNRS